MISDIIQIGDALLNDHKERYRTGEELATEHWGLDLEGTVISEDQIPRARYFVKALDQAMGGWPGGPNYCHMLFPCDTEKEAYAVRDLCFTRPELVDHHRENVPKVFKIATQEDLDDLERSIKDTKEACKGGSTLPAMMLCLNYDSQWGRMLWGLGSTNHHFMLMSKERSPYWYGLLP